MKKPLIISWEDFFTWFDGDRILFRGREFIKVPNLMCFNCHVLLFITFSHNPEKVEISSCNCKEDEK